MQAYLTHHLMKAQAVNVQDPVQPLHLLVRKLVAPPQHLGSAHTSEDKRMRLYVPGYDKREVSAAFVPG